jgi:hypothetical protein
MAVEIAQLKKMPIPKVTVKIGEQYNFFYVYFNGSISDRRNRLIVYFTPTLTTQNYMLLQPFLMNLQNKCVEINQVFCSVTTNPL